MDILPLVPEIKALVSSGQLSNQTQRPPFSFTTGQILQATVISREAANLFTLNVGGQEVPVETSAQLQAGQSLSVKVTTSSPQLQLQVVDNTSINQRISTSLHSMINQGEVFSLLSTLTASTPQVSQLSASSQDILRMMQANLSGLPPGTNQIHSLVEQISSSLAQSLAAGNTTESPAKTGAVNQLFQQLANNPELSAPLREQAQALANTFTTAQFIGGSDDIKAASAPAAALTNASPVNIAIRQQLSTLNPSLQTSLLPLLDQLGPSFSTSTGRAIEQLLTFLIQVGQEVSTPRNLQIDGHQLQQTLHRMGLNLEQLLLQGKTQDAAGTLKFALLELANLSTTSESHLQQIDDMLGSIQFSQLLQMRLSPESLFFLPLPFPFLQSGFLLIEDRANRDSEPGEKKARKSQNNDISLYLQLEGLGNLHITVCQDEEKISLAFYSQDTERAKFIGENKESLQELLTTGKLYSAQFLVGAKEPVKILIEKLLHAPTGMVNTVA